MSRLFQRDLSSEGQDSISLFRKLCYAVGGVPYQITTVAIGVSLQIFLLDVVQAWAEIGVFFMSVWISIVSPLGQLEAFYVSLILFVSRAWDAVTDPVVGYLVSRSKWTPIGKLTPWLLLSTPFAVLSYLLLWFLPRGTQSVMWFLTATCLFETLMSCFHVPYLSLSMFLGGNQRDRDSATAYRMSVEMLAMLLASVIQGQVVSVYNTEKQEVCGQLDHDAPGSSAPPHTAALQETQKAFLTSALVIGGVFFFCSLVLFLGVREHRAPAVTKNRPRLSYLASVRKLMCHAPFQRLLLGFLFSSFAFQMSLGNFALFCSHVSGLGPEFQHLLLVLLVSASVAVPIWQLVLLRIGKKATVFIGLSLFIPAVIIVACVPSSLPVSMTMCILMGFSVATVFLLPWSMLPDVVDDFAAKHPSCTHQEPLFFSCYAFSTKLVGGLSVGISTMTLQFVGYRADDCHHGDGVVTALVVLFTPVPITLLLLGMLCFHFYPIDERSKHQTTHDSPEASLPPPDQRDVGCASTPSDNPEQIGPQKSSRRTSRCKPGFHSYFQKLHRPSLTENVSSSATKKRSKVSWV